MYSQGNEEQIILDHFGYKFKGTVLDIGANDGITLSNSRKVIEMGWDGVLVEPSSKAFNLLKLNCENYPNSLTVNIAISDKCGELPFYESGEHLGQGDYALLSSLRKYETEQWKASGNTFLEINATCFDWKTFLYSIKFKTFDLITIDIEGEDYTVLSQMDLNELECKMLIVETNSKEDQKFIDYAGKFGMRLHRKNFQNLIFIR